MSNRRRSFTREFKVRVVEEYNAGVSIAELIRKYDIHANLVYKWTQEYRLNPTGAFRAAVSGDVPVDGVGEQKRIAELERMIGRLTMENDFLKKALKRADSRSRAGGEMTQKNENTGTA